MRYLGIGDNARRTNKLFTIIFNVNDTQWILEMWFPDQKSLDVTDERKESNERRIDTYKIVQVTKLAMFNRDFVK